MPVTYPVSTLSARKSELYFIQVGAYMSVTGNERKIKLSSWSEYTSVIEKISKEYDFYNIGNEIHE